MGDYPAQAKVTGTHDKVCHWCRYISEPSPETNRRKWCNFRAFLGEDHPYRTAPYFGAPCHDQCPPPRTHDGYIADALAQKNHVGLQKDQPYKATGVKDLCPLRLLPLFDLTWDIVMDAMHTIPGWAKAHIFPLFRGTRTPATPKWRKSKSNAENWALQRAHTDVLEDLKSWKLTKVYTQLN